MIIRERKVCGTQSTARQCSAPGCTRSARFDAIFLGSEFDPLCATCAKSWEEIYDHALFGWPDGDFGEVLARNVA